MNIFQLLRKWLHKGGGSANNPPPVFPSTTLIPTGTLEEVDNAGPANDVAHQTAKHVVDHATAVGSHGARWIGPRDTATVAGKDVAGMVYLFPDQNQSVRGQLSRSFVTRWKMVDSSRKTSVSQSSRRSLCRASPSVQCGSARDSHPGTPT